MQQFPSIYGVNVTLIMTFNGVVYYQIVLSGSDKSNISKAVPFNLNELDQV